MSVRLCVWPRAYNRAVDAALDSCFDEEALNDDYTDAVKSNDVDVIKVTKPTVQLRLHSGKFVWTISNASVSVHHHRTDQHHVENYDKEISGSFEVAIDFVRPPSSRGLIYNANVDLVDLLFTYASRNTGVNGVYTNGGYNNSVTINGVHYNGGNNSSVIINGVPYNGGTCSFNGGSFTVSGGAVIFGGSSNSYSYNSTDYQSAQHFDASKRGGSQQNAGPTPKRGRYTTPTTYSGINQSIRSIVDDESIRMSGINQSVTSSGKDAVLVSSGVNSGIVSSGDGVSITSSGVNGSVNSTGADAYIKASGCDVTIHSSGPNAEIHSSGTKVVITSSGANAQISASGVNATIKSTGTNASISNSGTNTRIQSSGSAINDDLGQTIIRRLRSAIVDSLNRRLPEIVEGHQWTVRDGYVEGSGDPAGLMLHGQDPQDNGRMITLLVSSDSIVNAFRSAFPNMPSCNLTQTDLIGQPSANNSSNNASRKPSCLSDFFPDFSTKYPGASMEVNLRGNQTPTASFSDENLKLTFPGSAVIRALLPDGSTVVCLSFEVTMEINVLLELNPGQLKGNVTSTNLKSIAVVETTLGSVNRGVLKNAFDHISTVFLSRKFDEICQRGIPLPRPLLAEFMEYENVVMSTSADGFLRMDADIKFRA